MTGFYTRAEEIELGRKALEGDMEAREKLILANTRFVKSVALKYANLGVPLDDLVQEGLLFMMRSFDYYSPDRPTRFKTLAWWWIKRGICECLTKNNVVRPPSKGYHPDDPRKFGCVTLDAPAMGANTPFGESLEDQSESALEVAIRKNEVERVRRVLRHLTPRKRQIVKMRFGIGIYKRPMKLGQIGDKLGISAERARQIMETSLDELRVRLAKG